MLQDGNEHENYQKMIAKDSIVFADFIEEAIEAMKTRFEAKTIPEFLLNEKYMKPKSEEDAIYLAMICKYLGLDEIDSLVGKLRDAGKRHVEGGVSADDFNNQSLLELKNFKENKEDLSVINDATEI
eukprot:Trichotokara_eunicae@DN9263_c0_g1_i1.p1